MTDPILSLRDRFGILFVGVARRWRAALDQSLASIGLTDASWSPLMHIVHAGAPISQKELAARVGIEGSSLVRLLDLLTEKGLIERRQAPDDRRCNRLFVTDAGRQAVADIQQVLSKVEGDLLADIDDAAMGSLTTMLEQIDARIRGLAPDQPAASPGEPRNPLPQRQGRTAS